MGEAMLSAADHSGWDYHVDHIPHGFKLVPTSNGIGYFFCVSCDTPVEP